MAKLIFGSALTLSTGRVIPVRWVGEQHVREDLGFIPSFADWARAIRPVPWMGRAQKLESETSKCVPVLSGVTRPNASCDELDMVFRPPWS
jgi:hypothetical protein